VPPASASPSEEFVRAWEVAERVDGWLTREQAQVLHSEAARIAPGRVVEIGSHQGRSTVVLGSSGARVTAIDPFGSAWRYGRTDTERRLRRHLAEAGVEDRVDVVVATSRQARDTWTDEVRLVYVDGKHDMWSCLDDLRWSRFLRDGDTVLVHDAFSSLGVTAALLLDAATTSRHVYQGRTGSLAAYRVGRPRVADRLRVLRELPWFVRNLVVKVLLRLRLRPLARLLGHHDSADPY